MTSTPETQSLSEELAAAQRTIAVLKAKVRELYACETEGAVESQLRQMRVRQQAARERRTRAEAEAAALQRHTARLDAEIAARTRDLKDILDNVTFGFLCIDTEQHVRDGFTRSCSDLLPGAVCAGAPITEVLGLDGTAALELELGLDQLFEDLMPEMVTVSQLPQRLQLEDGTTAIDVRALRDDDGTIRGALFTFSDVTALEESRKAQTRDRALLGILARQSAFEELVRDIKASIAHARELLERPSEEAQTVVRRIVHTIKGNVSTFDLWDLVERCHNAEQGDTVSLRDLEDLEDGLRGFMRQYEHILHMDYDGASDHLVSVSSERLLEVRDVLRQTRAEAELTEWAAMVTMQPSADFLGPIDNFATQLATRLEKQVMFEGRGLHTLVQPDQMRGVLRTVSHLVRNAIDHGIEPPDQRGDKPEVGHVSLTIEQRADSLLITVQDDGRGIEAENLVERAIELGTITTEQGNALSRQEKLALIFVDSLSLADGVSDVSGRGVGMAAVHSAVHAAGGCIETRSEIGQGTTFLLRVPHAKVPAVKVKVKVPQASGAAHPARLRAQ